MLDVTLLGTGGMMPLPNRYLTSLFVRCNGKGILIDCGEGTQMALRKSGLSAHNINTILLTHFHADHVSGLPGMLLTMGNGERTEPVVIYGPKGVSRIISAVRTIAPELPFEVEAREYTEQEMRFEADDVTVDAFRVRHNITCYGFSLTLPRTGKFDPEAAKAADIPLRYWHSLQKGETVVGEDGRVFTPDMVLGPARKGLKLVYCTDTRPTPEIEKYAAGADLLILEGMYGEEDKAEKAKGYKHMTMQEAAWIAKKAGPGELWLTHFSPSVTKADYYKEEIREIFPATVFPKDGRSVTLRFAEEEEA